MGKADLTLRQVSSGDALRYEVESGDLSPPRSASRVEYPAATSNASKSIGGMLLHAAWKQRSENLYKHGKVVGGVYFGLGQEACSLRFCLRSSNKDDWLGPDDPQPRVAPGGGFSPAPYDWR